VKRSEISVPNAGQESSPPLRVASCYQTVDLVSQFMVVAFAPSEVSDEVLRPVAGWQRGKYRRIAAGRELVFLRGQDREVCLEPLDCVCGQCRADGCG